MHDEPLLCAFRYLRKYHYPKSVRFSVHRSVHGADFKCVYDALRQRRQLCASPIVNMIDAEDSFIIRSFRLNSYHFVAIFCQIVIGYCMNGVFLTVSFGMMMEN